MKQEIIDQMQAHLGTSRFALRDFEIDKKSLEDYDGEFFWMSCENGTILYKISDDHIAKTLAGNDKKSVNEANRFAWFQDFYIFISGLIYLNENESGRFFYYDGRIFIETNFQTIKNIYDARFSPLYNDMKQHFKYEYSMAEKRIPIILNCPISRLKEALRYAESINDSSLLECLKSLRKYKRCAINQVVRIGSDFSKHGFTFANMINDECSINGGIIMHSYRERCRWSIHT